MVTEGATTRYIDEKYEFSAPQYFDFSAGETPEEAAEAERWFFTSRSYQPSPFVAKCRSLLESKDFSSFKDTYNQVQKLLARLSSEHGEPNLSGCSGTSEKDASANAKNSTKCREAIPIAPTAALEHTNANLSVSAYISTTLDPTHVSASSESKTENLSAPVMVSSGKKEQILSSALGNDSSCEKTEESAPVPVNIISSQKAEENTCSSASISVPETQDCQAEAAEDNVPLPIRVSFQQNEDKSLLPVRESWWREIIWEYIHVLFSQWILYCRQFWLGEIMWEYIHALFSQWLQCSSSLVLGSLVEDDNIYKSDKEAAVDAAVVCEPMQKVEIVEFSTPKCEKATGYSERSSNMHGKLLVKRDHFEVEKHEPQIRRRPQHLKKMKHTRTRYYRNTEMMATERCYANKRQKLEGGQARQVCNSRRSIHPVKAVPALTIPQEFHFQTEDRFQTHRGAYCQSFSQTRSPVSPYVPLAERVLRFQFNASECFRNRSDNQALKLTRPKEPDLATAQRARPPRVKSTAEIEEEMLASMPKFKARPLNKKILEGPTLGALPRSMPQLPEFQEFNLRTAERALQHPSASHKVASGSDTTFGSELDRHSSLMGGRFSAPYKSSVFTTLHAQSIKERSLEGMEERGVAKVSQFSSYSSDKKLMLGPTKERQSVTKEMIQIDENLVFEAQSLILRKNMRVPERTRKPLANIQCNRLPLEACGNQVKNVGPTLGSWKEKAIQGQPCQPSQPSQGQAHSGEPKDPATQMNSIIPWQDSWTLSPTFISRQMR